MLLCYYRIKVHLEKSHSAEEMLNRDANNQYVEFAWIVPPGNLGISWLSLNVCLSLIKGLPVIFLILLLF